MYFNVLNNNWYFHKKWVRSFYGNHNEYENTLQYFYWSYRPCKINLVRVVDIALIGFKYIYKFLFIFEQYKANEA